MVSPSALEQADVIQLQCRADQGVQAAQLTLAKRYEAGDGVPRDIKRAVTLYERASAAAAASTAVYAPAVRVGGHGQVLFLSNPGASPGLPEAQYRLGELFIEGRSIPQDRKRGRALIERAAKQGYALAMAALSTLKN